MYPGSPVDPGTHLVRLVAGDDERAQEHIQLEAGATGGVLILGPGDSSGSVLARPWFWTAAGVVVVAGAVAAVLVLGAGDEPDSGGGALVTF